MDLISRQAAIDAIKRYESAYSYDLNNGLILAMNAVGDIPTIDPVKHGKWIAKRDGWNGGFVVCSVCSAENGMNSKFCPNCGARME